MEKMNDGTPSSLRLFNKQKVLQSIRLHDTDEEVSRASLAAFLNISKPTMSTLIDELVAEEWIIEVGEHTQSSRAGRKPVRLSFNKNARYLIGIDIGGTHTECVLTNLAGEVIVARSFSTQEQLRSGMLLSRIAHMIEEVVQEANIVKEKMMSIGIGVPGITNTKTGVVVEAQSLGWKNFPLKAELEALTPYTIYIDNDVNMAVLGEHWLGKAKNDENVVMITLGTGVGCGMILNGDLYRGHAYAAGEIGHLVTDRTLAKENDYSSFEGYGFLDNQIGGPALTEQMNRRVGDRGLSAEQIFQLAAEDDADAAYVVEEMVSHLSFAIVNIVSIINPESLVLGGGISRSLHRYIHIFVDVMEQHLPVNTNIYITQNRYISCLGAAYLSTLEHDSILRG